MTDSDESDDEVPGSTEEPEQTPEEPEQTPEEPEQTPEEPEQTPESTTVTTKSSGEITGRYEEVGGERVISFEREGRSAAIAQNVEGYAMLKVRTEPNGDELERYYGFDMALDHAAERLGVDVADLPVPDEAMDMGM